MRLLVPFVFVCVLSASVCDDLCGQPCVYVHSTLCVCTCVCAHWEYKLSLAMGWTCGTALQEPRLSQAAGLSHTKFRIPNEIGKALFVQIV